MKSPRMQIRVMSDMDTESVPKYPADTEAGCVGCGQQHRLQPKWVGGGQGGRSDPDSDSSVA